MQSYFDFWNQFVQQWLQQNPVSFTNSFSWPHLLMNSDVANDLSTFYLPEPYWGWTNNDRLEMVIVNYNPYSGGPVQHLNQVSAALNSCNYQDFVTNQTMAYHAKQSPSLKPTSNWHFTRRAKKMSGALILKGYKQPITIHNYLGIDLIPWHTKDIRTLKPYFTLNKKAIDTYSIKFAIDASKHIANPYLHNKVILRMPWDKFNDSFGTPAGFQFVVHQKITTGKMVDNCYKLENPATGTELLFLWSNKRRNDLPPANIIAQFL